MGNETLLERLGGVPAFSAMLAEVPDEHLVLFDSIVGAEMHRRLESRKETTQAARPIDTDLLLKVIEVVDRKVMKGELRMDAVKKAELIVLAYEKMLDEEARDREASGVRDRIVRGEG